MLKFEMDAHGISSNVEKGRSWHKANGKCFSTRQNILALLHIAVPLYILLKDNYDTLVHRTKDIAFRYVSIITDLKMKF